MDVADINLYVKNLDSKVDDEELEKIFAGFHTMSCTIMRDRNGISVGAAFVSLYNAADVNRAISQLDGTMARSRPIKLSICEDSAHEERAARYHSKTAKWSYPEVDAIMPSETAVATGISYSNPLFSAPSPPQWIAPQPVVGYTPCISSVHWPHDVGLGQFPSPMAGNVGSLQPPNQQQISTGFVCNVQGVPNPQQTPYCMCIVPGVRQTPYVMCIAPGVRQDPMGSYFTPGFPNHQQANPVVSNPTPLQVIFNLQHAHYGFLPPVPIVNHGPQQATIVHFESNVQGISTPQQALNVISDSRVESHQNVAVVPNVGYRQPQPNPRSQGVRDRLGHTRSGRRRRNLCPPPQPLQRDSRPSEQRHASASEKSLVAPAPSEEMEKLLVAAAASEERHLILGEALYPLVKQWAGDQAGKVTGMILEVELGPAGILQFIASEKSSLKEVVMKALEVLRNAKAQQSDSSAATCTD